MVLLLLMIGVVQIGEASPLSASFTWTSVCGNQIQFTDTSSGNPGSWQWSFGNNGNTGDYSSHFQNPSVFINTGTHTVSLTINNGSQSSTTSQTVTVTPPTTPLSASFTTTPSSGTVPLTVQFTDTSTSLTCPINRWSWSFGDGSGVSTLQNPTYTYTKPCNGGTRTFPVTLTVYNGFYITGNYGGMTPYTSVYTASTTNNIVITAPSDPDSSFTATPTSGPAPLSVDFIDTSSNNPTIWSWNFGDGTGSNQKNPSHNYTISGVYTVTMQASSSTTCNPTNPATSTITVLSPLAPGTTTQTLTPNQTGTTAISTTSVTAQTTLPDSSSTQTVTATPTGFHYTPRPTATTIKAFTSIPINTPTQKSPIGIEFGILAIGAGILIIRKQS